MPHAPTNGIELCYETFGDPANETVVLVMGFTAQMIVWPDEMIDDLVGRGFHVVIFDNRDCGLSTKSSGPPPDVMALMLTIIGGGTVSADDVPYTLSDMAADAIGLLDHLAIDKAHVVGASMGGMIVQTMAIEHGHRLHSATSIMSTTGNAEVGQSTDEARTALLATPAPGRDAIIEQSVVAGRIFAGPLFDAERSRQRAAESFDRSFHPVGAAFQLAAIAGSGDRSEALASVDLPFLVIHGLVDELIDVSGGHATAAAIPGSDLLVLAAMGHDLPVQLLGQIVGSIEAIARRPSNEIPSAEPAAQL